MNRFRPLALLLALAAPVLLGQACAKPPAADTAKLGAYYCPMHPSFSSDRPGNCPICSMRLVRRSAATSETTKGAMAAAPALSESSLALGGIAVVPVARERIARSVRLPGVVAADEARRVEVVARFGGWLETLPVARTGERVRRGQTLARLFSPELVAGEEEYLRARESAGRFAGSTIPEVVTGGAELAEAARRRLSLLGLPDETITRIERTGRAERTLAITAPAFGWVTRLGAVRGARVEAGATLFEISDLSTVFVEASLPESDAALAVIGRSATLELAATPGRSRTGRLTAILPLLDAANRTLTVRVAFVNADLALKPGMSALVTLAEPAREALTLPDSCLLPTGERTLAFVEMAPGRFAPREVVVGARVSGRAEILSGLEVGEKVAAQAAFLLDADSRLRGALPTALPSAVERKVPR
ncbi:MAG TPA: efflux RND transporter periplasmic adaptor subunit [Thermoanaerobaculia bacterium]|jgi:multidrug efflux pump subunit AcrA (membrane-fusion protein)|nr:efflux RND transporter periplasmic adaptor subunit [Thermoanaerobaculia bacterium]